MQYFGDIEIINGSILNLKVENVSSLPTFSAEDSGRLLFNVTDGILILNDGTSYVNLSLPLNLNNIIDTLGSNWVTTEFGFNPAGFADFTNVVNLTGNSSLFDVLNQLDTAISEKLTNNLVDLQDIVETSGLSEGDALYYNGTDFTFGNISDLLINYGNLEINDLKNVDIVDIAAGDGLFYSAEQSKFVNRNIVFSYTDLESTLAHSIVHTLGVQYCGITLIDRVTNTLITDASITFTDINQVDILLPTPRPISAILVASAA